MCWFEGGYPDILAISLDLVVVDGMLDWGLSISFISPCRSSPPSSLRGMFDIDIGVVVDIYYDYSLQTPISLVSIFLFIFCLPYYFTSSPLINPQVLVSYLYSSSIPIFFSLLLSLHSCLFAGLFIHTQSFPQSISIHCATQRNPHRTTQREKHKTVFIHLSVYPSSSKLLLYLVHHVELNLAESITMYPKTIPDYTFKL